MSLDNRFFFFFFLSVFKDISVFSLALFPVRNLEILIFAHLYVTHLYFLIAFKIVSLLLALKGFIRRWSLSMQSFGPYFFKNFSVPSSFRKSIPFKVMSQLTDALLYHFFFCFFGFFFPSVYPALGGKNKCSTISLVFIKTVLYPKLLGHLFVILVFTCYWEGMGENTHLYLSMATFTNIMTFLPNLYIYS